MYIKTHGSESHGQEKQLHDYYQESINTWQLHTKPIKNK